MKKHLKPITFLTALCLVAAILFCPSAPTVKAEDGTGTGTLYYNVALKTDTSFSIGQSIMLSSTSNTLANTSYVGLELPAGFEARGTIVDKNDPALALEGSWSTSYSPMYGLIVAQRSAAMDTHNGWIAWNGTNWTFHCTGGSDRGTYYAYTVGSESFSPADVSITENSVSNNGSVSKSNLTITIKGHTLPASDFSLPDGTLNATNGDCTYSVTVGGVSITKFDPHRSDSVINALTDLNATQKAAYISALDSAANDSEVAGTLTNARETDALMNSSFAEIDNAETAQKAAIDALTELSDTEKAAKKTAVENAASAARTAINNATTANALNTAKNTGITTMALNKAKAEATNNLRSDVAAKTAAIDALTELSSSEKSTAKQNIIDAAAITEQDIENATDEAGLNTVVNNADNARKSISDNTVADDFIIGNLSDSNGNVFTAISSANVDKILNSQTKFAALSASQKTLIDNAVNTATGGVSGSYNDLISAANLFVSTNSTDFVATYLTDTNGNIYQTVDGNNKRSISSGKATWAAMSLAEKNAVNALLTQNGSPTYDDLYALANPAPTPAPTTAPKTGDSSNIWLWITLTIISLSGIAWYVISNKKKHNA